MTVAIHPARYQYDLVLGASGETPILYNSI